MKDMERVVEDDYKFLQWNVRKLFGIVGHMKSKWCKSCGKIRRGRRMVLAWGRAS
jgi:hypothetical protein